MKIVLPKGAFTVIPDKIEEKTAGGIILGPTETVIPDTGIIGFTCEELKEYQGKKVRFRGSFGEAIPIEDAVHLYFRDFDSSIYYIIKE